MAECSKIRGRKCGCGASDTILWASRGTIRKQFECLGRLTRKLRLPGLAGGGGVGRGTTEKIALKVVAAEIEEARELRCGFDAFRDHAHVEVAAEAGHG